MNVAPQTPDEKVAETHRRLGRLRLLIDDEQRRQRILFLMSLLSLAIVSLIAFLTTTLALLPIDLATTRELQEVISVPFLRLMVFVSAFGYMPWSAVMVAGGAIVVGMLFGWKHGAYLVLLTGVQGIANYLVKIMIGRPRPLDTLVNVFVPVSGNSFPSGHVMFYTVFFGFLFFLIWTRLPPSIWRALALILTSGLIFLIGPSRMYLGAHWLSDVVAAHLLGLIILAFGIEFYLRYLAPRQPAHQEGLVGTHDQALQK